MFKWFNEFITPGWCQTYYYGYKKSVKENGTSKEIVIDKKIYKKTFLMSLLVFCYDYSPLLVILVEANIAVMYDLPFPIMPLTGPINVIVYILIWLVVVFLIRGIAIRLFGIYMENKSK